MRRANRPVSVSKTASIQQAFYTSISRSQPIDGFLDDYAFLIRGLIDYYIATLDLDVLRFAKELQDIQNALFWDDENGGYFYSQANAKNVVVRLKEDHDGAEPCGNSVSAKNLCLLSAYFEDKSYKEKAIKLFDFFAGSSPFGYVLPEMFSALLLHDYNLTMLVIVGEFSSAAPSRNESLAKRFVHISGPNNDATKALADVARDFYIPGLLLVHCNTDEPIETLTRKSAAGFKMAKNESTVYLCHNRVCQLPITTPEGLRESLSERYLLH